MTTQFSFRIGLFAGFMFAAGVASSDDLKSKLMPLVEAHQGEVAVAIKHLDSGESFSYRADEPMPTASLIKFPVMVEAYQQAAQERIDLEGLIALREEDQVPGSGILTDHFTAGARISLRDAIRLMIVYSDNTATNLVLDRIGIASTAERMEELGLPHTKIHGKVFRRETSVFPERSRQFGLGSTTAHETLRLYELLHQRQLVSPLASQQMLDHLVHCADQTKLVRFLPAGTQVAHKGGAVSQVRCEAGIVLSPGGPFVVCVFTSGNQDRSWQIDNAGNKLCATVAQTAFRHFNPDLGAAAERWPAELNSGDSGRLVEDLQRTLNARLTPSPKLSVDGEFGPLTQAAVQRFQSENGLVANGVVQSNTWAALGPLVTRDPPVPEPAAVNSEQLVQEPQDALEGVPFVTCEAWAIADGETGQLLWGHHAEAPLDFASVTKIMTALVVLRLAEEDVLRVLAEEVVFSARADATIGSTAGIRAGERLSVRELLYGLLLPSGNDASVALAEHFGDRFVGPGAASQTDPVERFVAKMNRTATSLGMDHTSYRNPHGLTEKGHVSTARDLLRLAHAAWHQATLRSYVSTRQHGCTLVGPGGYRRNVVWKNTNRLLTIEGYQGLKTGTTRAAGACLVSSAARGGDQLLMVVLGAKSSDARYVDSRNLYRWAWNQRSAGD